MTTVQHQGIDVSSNNPHPIDYVAVVTDLRNRGGGAQPFVIVKATQGTGYVNPYFREDVAGFQAAGAAVGAYLMDQGNDDPAAEEAYFKQVTGLPQFDDDELPSGLTVAQYITHCAGLVAQNPSAIVYLNQSEENEGFPTGAGDWEANYNNLPNVTNRPAIIHQFSSSGTVAGIGGQVDLNAWLGTESQFAQVFGLTPLPAPISPELDMTQLPKIVTSTNPATGKSAVYVIRATDVKHAPDGVTSSWAWNEWGNGATTMEAVAWENILWWNNGQVPA